MRYIYTLGFFISSAMVLLAQDFSESYAPIKVKCPAQDHFNRPASDGLNPDKEVWLYDRKRMVTDALSNYLSHANMTDFNVQKYIAALHKSNYTATPAIGAGISGGGYAPAIFGTGLIRALDGRQPEAVAAGTGGLLQSMSFYSGQSGGSWAVMSYIASDGATTDQLLQYWQPQINRFISQEASSHTGTTKTYLEQMGAKLQAGFKVSVGDYLGLGNGYEFIEGPDGGINKNMSGIRNYTNFVNHRLPLPIIQVDHVTELHSKELEIIVPTMKSNLYEITPYEFGTWSGPSAAFTDIEYLGTNMMKGRPVDHHACIKGYDRIDWVIGVSANAFEYWWLEAKSNNTLGQFPKRDEVAAWPHGLHRRLDSQYPPEEVDDILEVFQYLNLTLDDVVYTRIPNPFGKHKEEPRQMKLVDATEAISSLPLAGQLARNASLILAWDNNSEAFPNGWQNGTSMYQAYIYFKEKGVPFPIVPSPSTFIARNYTTKPTFFGCNANLTTTKDTQAPIIAWFGNAPYSSYSNISYTQTTTPFARVHDLWNNTFNQITQGSGSLDSEWSACLACAAIDRSLEKVDPPMQRSAQCERCFAKYCWDGVSEPEWGHVDVDSPCCSIQH